MTISHTITTASLEDAVARAIATLLDHSEGEAQATGVTIVFSGEGTTPADATRDALGDIVAQCDAQRCAPATIAVDGVMRTDHGYRVWGTLGCRDGHASALTSADVEITEGEGGEWTLTINGA